MDQFHSSVPSPFVSDSHPLISTVISDQIVNNYIQKLFLNLKKKDSSCFRHVLRTYTIIESIRLLVYKRAQVFSSTMTQEEMNVTFAHALPVLIFSANKRKQAQTAHTTANNRKQPRPTANSRVLPHPTHFFSILRFFLLFFSVYVDLQMLTPLIMLVVCVCMGVSCTCLYTRFLFYKNQ